MTLRPPWWRSLLGLGLACSIGQGSGSAGGTGGSGTAPPLEANGPVPVPSGSAGAPAAATTISEPRVVIGPDVQQWPATPQIVRVPSPVQLPRPATRSVRYVDAPRTAVAPRAAVAPQPAVEPDAPSWFHYRIDDKQYWVDAARPGDSPLAYELGSQGLAAAPAAPRPLVLRDEEDESVWFSGPDRAPRRLSEHARSARFSADGQFLVVTEPSGLALYDVAADELVRYRATLVNEPRWHPSEARVAYIDNVSRDGLAFLTLLDARSRARSRWLNEVSEFKWSPDGHYLALVRDVGGPNPCRRELLILNAGGGADPARWVSCWRDGLIEIQWSGDSTWLAYRYRNPERMAALHLRSGKHYEFSFSDAGTGRWTVNDQMLASGLYGDRVSVASLQWRAAPIQYELSNVQLAEWSPAGPYFTARQERRLVLIDARRPATGYGLGSALASEFSPDGRWLAYTDQDRVFVRRVGSPPGAAHPVVVWTQLLALQDESEVARSFRLDAIWAPREAQLAFARLSGGQVQVELASSSRGWQPIVLSVHPGNNIGSGYWRPRQRRVLQPLRFDNEP